MTVIEKPWGKEEWLEVNDKYVVKRIHINKGHRCSLQMHNEKKETICLITGKLSFLIGEKIDDLFEMTMHPGDFITLNPKTIHRSKALEDSIFIEASTIELDDVVRFEDDYDRE